MEHAASATSTPEGHARLVAALRRPGVLGGDEAELIETHISSVLLSGAEAFKLKKPVNFGFVDFSTLERRHRFCEEELRLNSRTAPKLYREVVPITGTLDEPRLGGDGTPIEFAVRMRRFDQTALLNHAIENGQLHKSHVDALAAAVADFHSRAEIAQDADYGSFEQITTPVAENFRVLADCCEPGDERHRLLTHLREWSEATAGRLKSEVFPARRSGGFIRECHGDLHLGNLLLDGDAVTVFDGVEFNPDYRWVDVISDAAFCMMDFAHRGRPDFAFQFLNGYLERTGDYAGLEVLPFYLVYRAMVRAKVAYLRGQQADSDEVRAASYGELADYLGLAEYTRPPAPWLFIMVGASGSGKSTAAAELVPWLGAVRVRSDVERKRLATGRTSVDLYSPAQTHATYARLAAAAEYGLKAGVPMIVDATCLERERREQFARLAARLELPYLFLVCEAQPDTLRERIRRRAAQGGDPSDADLAVLEEQLRTREPLTPAEQQHAMTIDTEADDWLDHLASILPELKAPPSPSTATEGF